MDAFATLGLAVPPQSVLVAADPSVSSLGRTFEVAILDGRELRIGVILGLLAVMGITDLFGGDDDDDDESALAEDDDDDDLFGGTADMDDSFDDIGGFGDDGDPMADVDGSVDELEGRLDELENEVASVSSSISTVRSENEEISETVTEVEGHVRDLLDIYEMVTRGVNPFVDEGSGGQFPGASESTIGLFTDDDGGEESGGVDEGIADAEAESFFEDELDEPEDDELASPADVGGDALSVDTDPTASADDGGGSKSFEELKAEYENGDSDWEDGAGSGPDDAPRVDQPEALDVVAEPAPAVADATGEEPSTEPVESEEPVESGHDGGRLEFLGDRESRIDVVDADAYRSTGKDRPHLRTFPPEYVADLTAIEWMEDLVDVGGREGATAALEYYVDIGWIGEAVREELEAILAGIGDPSGPSEPSDHPLAAFGSVEHRRSLGYVSQLAGDTDRAVAIEQIEDSSGGRSRGA